jgi:hypothetical protein
MKVQVYAVSYDPSIVAEEYEQKGVDEIKLEIPCEEKYDCIVYSHSGQY